VPGAGYGTTTSISAMTTTLDPPADAPMNADRATPTAAPRPGGVSLRAPAAIFATVFLGAAILAFEPQENAVDRWGYSIFSDSLQSSFLHAVTYLALGPVTAGLAVLAGLVVWRRDRLRTLACLVGPGLAVGLAEVLKIIVGRRLEQALCWPSGSAAAVAAVMTAVILAAGGRARWPVRLVASAAVILEVVALVAYRSHYLSDALGGVLVGVGSVLLIDAVLHLRRRGRTTEPKQRLDPPVSEPTR
jgi:membrane-associated phospholipid phosphatase